MYKRQGKGYVDAIAAHETAIRQYMKDYDADYRILDESILTAEDIDLPLLETAARGDIPKTLMLVYETSGSTPVKSGSYMVVDANTATAGTIGGGCSESRCV